MAYRIMQQRDADLAPWVSKPFVLLATPRPEGTGVLAYNAQNPTLLNMMIAYTLTWAGETVKSGA